MNVIKRARRTLGITQSELAEQLRVTRQHVYGLEQGTSTPSLELAVKLSEILNITIVDIFNASKK